MTSPLMTLLRTTSGRLKHVGALLSWHITSCRCSVMHLSTPTKEVPQNYPIRVNLNTGLFGQNKGQAYPLSGKVFKNKAVFPVHLGEIKGLLIAIQHWEIPMTDLGL